MRGHNNFFDKNHRAKHKIVSAIYVDYLPGDILAYTDREDWHNIFVKEEFYARTKSLKQAKELMAELHHRMVTDFYDLKSEEEQKAQKEREGALRNDWVGLISKSSDLKQRLREVEEEIAQMKHDYPNDEIINPRKEN